MKLKLKPRELALEELLSIIERAGAGPLGVEDREKLQAVVETLVFLTRELESKGTSIQRLRKLLFGASTEKTSRVLGEVAGNERQEKPGEGAHREGCAKKEKRPGHGRNGAAAYPGAKKVVVHHGELAHGAGCPSCQRGKVYLQSNPKVLVRVTGMAPVNAKVYALDRLRCNLCGVIFTAPEPPGIGEEKYDDGARAMIGLLKYGCGLPFHRLEKLQNSLGIPLPAATQWELVNEAMPRLEPAHNELIRQAAQGEVLHNDDTPMKVLDLMKAASPQEASTSSDEDDEGEKRTGVRTSGIVSEHQGHHIALFFTGHNHAGDNLKEVLAQRAAELGPPIQMCDALSHNTAGEFDTILANCLGHARRRYVDVVENFPQEVRHVLETLREVYNNDAMAKNGKMSPAERLRFHQRQSGPLMGRLKRWMNQQIKQKQVEPNSGLGEAIRYMKKHWKKLILFLRVPGAPLDNNVCERALKKAILHRKNSLFYKTENGARVGDRFMSLIHTAELSEVNTFDYLVALLRNHGEVSKDPSKWMPWNYTQVLERLATEPLNSG